MDFGSLKYMGQVRMMPVYANKKQEDSGTVFPDGVPPKNSDDVVDYEYVKCGYGKMVWPDGSTFEGYWINGQACSVGVFRAPEPQEGEVYEGFWQQDRQTNLCVFRQNIGSDIVNEIEAYES